MVQIAVDPARYRSFLVRLWKEAPDLPWRYQVRDVASGDEQRFADVEHLIDFLKEASAQQPGVEPEWTGQEDGGHARLGLLPGTGQVARI